MHIAKAGGDYMAVESLQDLFVEELRDMYDGEKRLLKALPKMAQAATSRELQMAFTNHRKETERQVGRLEQVFRTVSQKPRGKKCDGIMGIVEEGNKAMEELEEGPVLDAALIAGAQKVEHYEIASYGTLAYFAELLENERAKDLLGTTLDEEKAADEKLNVIAKSDVNRRALTDSADDADETSDILPAGMFRRAATAVGMAEDRRRRSSPSRGGSSRRTSKKR
jgi:ferritin-like metal-binding protein YciE